MYNIVVVNVRNTKEYETVHRPSPLGNPFPIGPNANRNQVCDEYEIWFGDQVQANNPLVWYELLRLHHIGKVNGVLRLGCYCSPQRCHGDTIAKFLMHNFDLLEELELDK